MATKEQKPLGEMTFDEMHADIFPVFVDGMMNGEPLAKNFKYALTLACQWRTARDVYLKSKGSGPLGATRN